MRQVQKVNRAKVGVLELAKQLGNVSQACRVMGYSRDSFYRFKELYDKGGEAAPPAIGIDSQTLAQFQLSGSSDSISLVQTFESPLHTQGRAIYNLKGASADEVSRAASSGWSI